MKFIKYKGGGKMTGYNRNTFTCDEMLQSKFDAIKKHHGKKTTRMLVYLIEKEFERLEKEKCVTYVEKVQDTK
jgi:hypothetical protein